MLAILVKIWRVHHQVLWQIHFIQQIQLLILLLLFYYCLSMLEYFLAAYLQATKYPALKMCIFLRNQGWTVSTSLWDACWHNRFMENILLKENLNPASSGITLKYRPDKLLLPSFPSNIWEKTHPWAQKRAVNKLLQSARKHPGFKLSMFHF